MENESGVILIITVASMLFLLLVLAIITFTAIYNRRIIKKDNELKLTKKNQELAVLRASIESQSMEREKIALNLHDEVGPLLSTMKLKMFQNQKNFKKGELQNETFEKDREFLDTIIKIVRKVSHDLSPSFVTKFGIERAIDNFMSEMQGIEVEFESNIDDDVEIPNFISSNLYYIITELINNLIKHDGIKQLHISFRLDKEELTISINHDGIGYTQEEFDIFEKNSEGLGLSSIKSRSIVIGGELIFRKHPDSPKIEIKTPVNAT
jgi:signal transduction histidine kinase